MGKGKEGMSEGEGEGAHTPPFEGERERERERDIDPHTHTHTHTHTRTILLTADRLNQHTLYESKYVRRRERIRSQAYEKRAEPERAHTPPLAVPGAMVCWRYTPPLLRSQREREKRSSVVCTRKHKSLEPGLSLSRS